MKVVLYKEDTLKLGCDIALKNRLYVAGWRLSVNLKHARKTGKGEVSIVYLDDLPVACAYSDDHDTYPHSAVNSKDVKVLECLHCLR